MALEHEKPYSFLYYAQAYKDFTTERPINASAVVVDEGTGIQQVQAKAAELTSDRLHIFVPEKMLSVIRGNREIELPVIRKVTETNWQKTRLDIESPNDVVLAAKVLAHGIPVCYSFGNFTAIAAHPAKESVQLVNQTKGRPLNQVGSITTTRDRMLDVFDWSKVDYPFIARDLVGFMDEMYQRGPFGFRGPASGDLVYPELITLEDNGMRTVQIIAPGYACPSNGFIEKVIQETGNPYAYITSANVSSHETGQEEPAHYRLGGMQREFIDNGKRAGYVVLGYKTDEREAEVQNGYEGLEKCSTTIVSFVHPRWDEHGKFALTLDRLGSMDAQAIVSIASKYGFGLVFSDSPKAHHRQPIRIYND